MDMNTLQQSSMINAFYAIIPPSTSLLLTANLAGIHTVWLTSYSIIYIVKEKAC